MARPVAEHGGAVVHGAADGLAISTGCTSDLKALGEGTVDGTLEALLDPVEQTHCPASFCLWTDRS